MKKDTYIETELPLQMKLILAATAIATSAIVVALGCIIFETTADNLADAMFAGIKDTPPFHFSLSSVWQLPLVVFGVLSLYFYNAFKCALMRRLSMP
jgi:hypothetical protein